MRFEELRQNWNRFGKTDPLWAILTDPSKRHNKWDPVEFFRTGQVEISAAMERLRKLGLHPQTHGRALDFGCGAGRLTQALSDHFQTTVGVDIAESMIAQARKFNQHGPQCTYLVNDTSDLKQFASESFDFVYSHIVLQHMRPEYSTVYIAEFMRVLKSDGGIAIFDIPAENTEIYRPGLRNRLASGVHNTANFAWRLMKGKPFFPKMEMYPVSKSRVEQIVAAGGGRVVDAQLDTSCGKGWSGYSYVIAK
jgi:ubiquinone/menaquinone biosynthesis C-methylase UbiE